VVEDTVTYSERRDRPAAPGGFWGTLSESERTTLSGLAARRVFAKDAMLCREGDDSGFVVVIMSGFAKVFTTSRDGDESMLGVRGPGDTVGEIGAFGRRPRTATVIALDQVRGLVMDAERFRKFLEASPHASGALSTVLMTRQMESDRRFTMGSSDGERRLARLLIELSERFGERGANGEIGINLPLSQTELASWIGKSREMVARAYRTWRDADVVRTGRRAITVMDVAELRRIADGERRRAREEGN
jgi:CRP-like cAMP-binding protein